MKNTEDWLIHTHSHEEDVLTRCQEAVESEDWTAAINLFQQLITHLKGHISMEEDVLFPAYEQRPGTPRAPVLALRDEHERIISHIKDILQVMGGRNSEHVLECLSSLERLLTRHHEKEEEIFLPMAGRELEDEWVEVSRIMVEYDASRSSRKWDF